MTDGNDNGAPGPLGIQSTIIVLTPGGEPAGETGQGGQQDDASDTNGNMTVDFGFVPNMSIGSTVFNDPNDNGIQDLANPQESGIQGVALNLLYDANGDGTITGAESVPVATATTDALGNYYFPNLPIGNYQIVIPTVPNAAPSSSAASNPDNQADGDDNGAQPGGIGTVVSSPMVNLTAGAEPAEANTFPGNAQDNANELNGDMTIDFGFVPSLSIGSTVFYDVDDDGIQDADPLEYGIAGVTVHLYFDANGDGAITGGETAPLTTTTTDANGDYFFGNLDPGNYLVAIPTAPADATVSSTGQDVGEIIDGNDNGAPGALGIQSAIVTLTAGGEPAGESGQGGTQDDASDTNGNMTIDFGFVPIMSVGSTVFYDINNDGLQNGPGEVGISGIAVQLLTDIDSDGLIELNEVVDVAVTDANGDYYFGNLPQGAYQIAISTVPVIAPFSSTGSYPATGVDGNDNGVQAGGSGTVVTSEIFTLIPGTEPTTTETGQGGNQDAASDNNGDMTIDFGFLLCAPPQTYAITLQVCSNALTGDFNFDALHAAELVTTNTFNGPVPIGLTVTFHQSLADANNDVNPLPNIYSSQNANIWARVESLNSPACYSVEVVQLVVNPLPILLLTKTDETCSTSNDGTVSVLVTNSPGNYNYDWSNLPGTNNPASQTGLNGGTYTVTVTDGNGCSSAGSVNVAEGPALQINPMTNLGPLCPGQSFVPPTLLSATPANPGIVYTWSGGAGAGLANGTATGSNPFIPAFTASNVEGVYTVTVTATLGTSPNQCSDTETFTITIDDVNGLHFVNCPATPLVFGNNPDQCSANVNWLAPTALDNCGVVTVTQTAGPAPGAVIPVTCPPTNVTVTYQANDGNGNVANCSFLIRAVDTQRPAFDADVVMPGNIRVSCDAIPTNCIPRANGACLPLTTADLSDNCTAAANVVITYTETTTQGANPATCSSGNYTITRTWTVRDCAGNELVHTQLIDVSDNAAPTAVCRNITVTLNDFGAYTIVPRDLDNGSTDNCAANANLTFTASQTVFTCADVAASPVSVILTVTDPCGNFSTCTAQVTVLPGRAADPCHMTRLFLTHAYA